MTENVTSTCVTSLELFSFFFFLYIHIHTHTHFIFSTLFIDRTMGTTVICSICIDSLSEGDSGFLPCAHVFHRNW
jgi:hypothetical protein